MKEALSWPKFAMPCYHLICRKPEKHWPVPLSTVPDLGTRPLKVLASGGNHWLTDPTSTTTTLWSPTHRYMPIVRGVQPATTGGLLHVLRQIGVQTSGDQEERSSKCSPPTNAPANARPAHAPAAGNLEHTFLYFRLATIDSTSGCTHCSTRGSNAHRLTSIWSAS